MASSHSITDLAGPIRFALIAAAAVACLAGPLAAGGVDPAELKAVVTGPSPTKLETQAATELAAYLERMYGVKLPVEARKDMVKDVSGVVLVGKDAVLAAGAISAEELEEVRWDGYVIRVADGRVALAGPRGRATLFGVAGLLERLGARFYGVAETVPDLEGKPIPEFVLADKPAFEFRRLHGGWKLKTGRDDLANCRSVADPEVFGDTGLSFDHTAGYLVPPPLYYEKHPEYYALVDGKRIFRTAKGDRRDSFKQAVLCLSNPNVTRIAAERMIAWMDREPEKRFFPCTYGDTGTHCQCEDCKKLDEVPGEYTDRKLHWVNGVARRVARKHPDKVLLTWAYSNMTAAPHRVKPEPNVVVCFAPWWGAQTNCRMHPYFLGWRSIVGARQLEQWYKWCPDNLGWYDYAGWWPGHRAFPFRLKFSAKRGYRAFFQLSRTKRFTGMAIYVKARLAWDPTRDPVKLEKEFCSAYYGPQAGPLAWEYIDAWYQEFVEPGTHRPRGDPAYPGKALALLERIEKAVADSEEYKKRVMKDLEGFHKDDKASWKDYARIKGPARYHVLFGGSLEQFKEWMRHCKNTGIIGPEYAPIEPEIGFQGYDREHLCLSIPKIHRREFQDDAKLTRIDAIVAGGHKDAGRKLRAMLKTIYGIDVPLKGLAVDKDTRGVVVLGRAGALASGLVDEADFKAAGPAGVVVRGMDGRVAITASRDENMATALEAFLYILRSRHGGVEHLGDQLPKSPVPIIRAFTLIDRPPLGPVAHPGSN